jgi:hypothetical protein
MVGKKILNPLQKIGEAKGYFKDLLSNTSMIEAREKRKARRELLQKKSE